MTLKSSINHDVGSLPWDDFISLEWRVYISCDIVPMVAFVIAWKFREKPVGNPLGGFDPGISDP